MFVLGTMNLIQVKTEHLIHPEVICSLALLIKVYGYLYYNRCQGHNLWVTVFLEQIHTTTVSCLWFYLYYTTHHTCSAK